MTLAEVAAAVGGNVVGVEAAHHASILITDVVLDSRIASPGALFVAVRGERVDGHDFAAAAVAAGALAVLAEHPVGAPTLVVNDTVVALGLLAASVRARLIGQAHVIAVTGSSGKTSTKDLLAAILETAGPTVAPRSSYNNDIGLPLTLLSATADTSYLVLEMGSRGRGHIARLCTLARPDFGLVLNVGRAHIGEFGDLTATAAAKGELVESAAVAVLNADDPLVAQMASRARDRVVTFGRSSAAEVRAVDVRMTQARAAFTMLAGGVEADVALTVVGEHQVSNALGATAVALELGFSLPWIAEALSKATARSSWRMELTERPDGVTVVNDAYNANPESMAAALHTLAALALPPGDQDGAPRRTWAVLGQMAELGPAAESAHREIGRLAVELAVSRLVVVGVEAAGIHAEAVHTLWQDASDEAGTQATHVPDVEAAMVLLAGEVRAGDVVLVKGSRVAALERIAAGLLVTRAGQPS